MATAGHGDHQLKRIVLPSGKTIEVVYFDHPGAAPPPSDAKRGAPKQPKQPKQPKRKVKRRTDLHACLECESQLVYPVHWEEADDRHWSITLRCPNCERREEGVFEQDVCDDFDDELERGCDQLSRDYKRLVTANLADEIDRFVHALQVDGIQPMDF